MMRIFLIEDDCSLRRELTNVLDIQGFKVESITDFSNAAKQALASKPDCVLLDLTLPGTSGQSICRDIRAKSDVPIIILTSSDSEFDEVTCLNLGADSYLTKPYSPAILLAHIQSVLRRSKAETSRIFAHKGVSVDLAKSAVTYKGKEVELTKNELRILALLIANPDCIITRQEIMLELWESDTFIDDNTLTVNVNRLRSKLESIGIPAEFVKTKRGQGYLV